MLRVVAVYAVVAWVVLQVAAVVSEPLGFPTWTIRALIIAAIVGFPVSFVLAWVIDIRPEGLIFDVPLFGSNEEVKREQRTSDIVFAGLLIFILSGGSYYLIVKLLNESESILPTEPYGQTVPSNSIAVLAFESFDSDSEADYFATGLSEEILHLLAGLEELQVASPTSSFQFKGKQIDIRDIAKILNVSKVLEGSARQIGNNVRAKAYLSDGETGFSNWVRSFQRPSGDIFAVQQEIATSVVAELKLTLSALSNKELRKQATKSSDAYIDYLNGIGRLRASLDADVMQEASGLFRRAIDKDHRFSKAYAGLCEAHLRLYEIRKDIGDFEVAENACKRAGELDPGLNAEINLALGKLYLSHGWFDRADKQLRIASKLADDSVDARIELGRLRLAQARHEEAEQILRNAAETKPNYWLAQEALASFYYRSSRYKDAAIAYQKAVKLAPDVATVFGGQGANYWMMGDFEKAIGAYEESLRIKPSRQAYTNLGSLNYYAGHYDKAVQYQKSALKLAPDDHRVWGRLAAAYKISGHALGAEEAYRQAISLAEKNIELNRNDWKTNAMLGAYYARLGEFEKGLEYSNKSLEYSKGAAEAFLYHAYVHVERDDKAAALDALESAVRKSEDYRQFIARDPFLQVLKGGSRFQALLPNE